MTTAYFLVQAPVNVLKGFGDFAAPVLFRSLTESVDGVHTPVLAVAGWLFLVFGSFLLLVGDVMRTKEKRGDEHLHERVFTWILLVLLFASSSIVSMGSTAADSLLENSGVSAPSGVATRMVMTAYSLPDISRVFDMTEVSKAVAAARLGDATKRDAAQSQALQDDLDGTMWGTAMAYIHALVQAGANGAKSVDQQMDDSVGAILRSVTSLQGFFAAVLRCLLVVLPMLLMYPMLILAGSIAWVMEQIRYVLLVSGTALLPLFVGGFSLPEGHFFRNACQNFVIHLLAVVLWPVAWMIGHSGTVPLYEAWLSLVASTTQAGPQLISYLKTRAIMAEPGLAANQVDPMLHSITADWLASGLMPMLTLTLSTFGLCVWIVIVSVSGPKLMHAILATGAQFMLGSAPRGAMSVDSSVGHAFQTVSATAPFAPLGGDHAAAVQASRAVDYILTPTYAVAGLADLMTMERLTESTAVRTEIRTNQNSGLYNVHND